jgi:hypothetical protein
MRLRQAADEQHSRLGNPLSDSVFYPERLPGSSGFCGT